MAGLNHCVVNGHSPSFLSTGDKGPLRSSKRRGEAITTVHFCLRDASHATVLQLTVDIMGFKGTVTTHILRSVMSDEAYYVRTSIS